MDVVSDAHVMTNGDSVYAVERTGNRDFISVYATEGIQCIQMSFQKRAHMSRIVDRELQGYEGAPTAGI